MRAAIVSVFALVATAVSCSSSKSDAPASDASKLTFTTGDFDIGAGDAFECFYTDTITPRELGVHWTSGKQFAGGHHITVYYTDIQRPAGHHKCEDAEMVNWHMVGGTGGDGGASETEFGLPEGFALKVPAGKQLVVQAHYINTSGKTRTVNDTVTLSLLEPKQVKQYANNFVGSHEEWTMPPKAPFQTTSTCTVKQDVQLILLLGHMHELGKHYKLDRVDATGTVLETLYEKDWQESYAAHPPVIKWPVEKPYILKAGTKLQQTCNWNNSTDNPVIFPREMCVFFGYYYPDSGEIFCDADKK